MNWKEIFSPELFIEDMLYRGEIEQYEIDESHPYGQMVSKLCHKSIAWMYKRILEDYPELLDNIYLVTGSYSMGGIFSSLRMEHSWLEYRLEKQVVVIDLTVSQFRKISDELYVGDRSIDYKEYSSICCSNFDDVMDFILSL